MASGRLEHTQLACFKSWILVLVGSQARWIHIHLNRLSPQYIASSWMHTRRPRTPSLPINKACMQHALKNWFFLLFSSKSFRLIISFQSTPTHSLKIQCIWMFHTNISYPQPLPFQGTTPIYFLCAVSRTKNMHCCPLTAPLWFWRIPHPCSSRTKSRFPRYLSTSRHAWPILFNSDTGRLLLICTDLHSPLP